MRVALALLALGSVLAALAAGCGGSEPSPGEKWASSVCTEVSDWRGQIEKIAGDVRTELQSPGLNTLGVVRSGIQQGVEATRQLGTDLRQLPPPPVENGPTAKQLVDGLADDLQQTVDGVEQQAQTLRQSPSLTQALNTLTDIAASISSAVQKTKSTVDSMTQLTGEIRQGFEDADACDDLRE
jgi:hypothetical protein